MAAFKTSGVFGLMMLEEQGNVEWKTFFAEFTQVLTVWAV